MNALDAKRLADKNSAPRGLSKYIKHCHDRIIKACYKGEYSIVNPLDGLENSERIGVDELRALWGALRAEGYFVDVPAFGNTWLRAFVMIRWD